MAGRLSVNDLQDDNFATLLITSKGVEHLCLLDRSDQELIEKFRWHLNSQGYSATRIEGKQIMMHRLILGVVDHPELTAAKAYDRAARELFGEFCNPNFIKHDPLPQQMTIQM